MLTITPETAAALGAPAQRRFQERLCRALLLAVPEHMLPLDPVARQARTDALVEEARRRGLVSERDVTRFAQLALEEGPRVAERFDQWRAAQPARPAPDLLAIVEREFHTLT